MPLDQVLTTRRQEILNHFLRELRGAEDVSGLPSSMLIDHLPHFLDEVVTALQPDGDASLKAPARLHGEQRFRVGFDLGTIVREYELLRRAIVRVLEDADTRVMLRDFEILAKCFNMGLVEAVTEFTKHRDAEVAAAVQAREDVIQIVSHDLRGPLGVVKDSADSMGRALDDGRVDIPDMKRHVSMTARAAARMDRLVDDLFVVSRLEAGNLDIRMHTEVLGALLSEVVAQAAPVAEERNIVILSELVSDAELLCDRTRLLQALGHVLENAIKVTPEGGAVTVRAGQGAKGCWFSVRDVGPGFDADKLPHALDARFRRPASAHARDRGLGLALARGIVELHRGRIWIESTAAGATVHMTLAQDVTAPARKD